jgi:signal transduction histidine kinase
MSSKNEQAGNALEPAYVQKQQHEIDQVVISGKTEILSDRESMVRKINESMDKAEFEARIMIPQATISLQIEKIGIFQKLASQKINKNMLVRLVSPLEEANRSVIHRISPLIQYKKIEPLSMDTAIFIQDKKEVLLLGFAEPADGGRRLDPHNRQKTKSADSIPLRILLHSSDRLFVETMLSTFEAWWNQVDINEKMLDEKKHTELLLDLITHDIGNHNQVISLSLDLLRESVDMLQRKRQEEFKDHSDALEPKRKNELIDLQQMIDLAKQAHEKSVSLVANIRRLEKMYREKEVKLEPVDLVSSMESAISTVRQPAMGKEISFTLKFDDKDNKPYVLADQLLEEVFANLFSNAVKATNGTLTRIEAEVQGYSWGRVKYWMINVVDYGHGIPDEKKKEIFGRFYSKAGGTGLGLAIVRALVERYNGKVWAGDRVFKDHSKGARIGMILARTTQSPQSV